MTASRPTDEAGPVAERAADPRACGERIEALLEASAASGPLARERSEELVRLVVDLYGAGLQRVLELAHQAGALSDGLLEQLAEDELVASLLLVHGLHPYGVTERVERALTSVRPYLGSHGGDVELLGVDEAGVVRLRMLGSCDGCPSSAATLTLAVQGAIEAAAPEVTGIEVQEETPAPKGLISVDSLRSRLADGAGAAGATWLALGGLDELPDPGVRARLVGGVRLVVCRIGSDLFAYRDRCPVCSAELAQGSLGRVLGGASGTVALTCPGCRSHFDVRHAGAGVGVPAHLQPVPLLHRDGVVEVAVPTEAVPA